MDSQRFDNLTRTLSSGSSRRTLLRGVLGGAAALVGLRAATISAAPQGKVDVCHYDADSGTYHKININGNALQAHLNHGDNSDIGCADGFALNTDTCECEVVNPFACDAYNVSTPSCGVNNNGFCVNNVETGGLVCIGPAGCIACGDGCADGWVCVTDGGCGGAHCHPLQA